MRRAQCRRPGHRRHSNTLPPFPQAHDEQDDCNIGDTVRIHICRPLSKNKSWRVTEVLARAKQLDTSQMAPRAKQNTSFAASAILERAGTL